MTNNLYTGRFLLGGFGWKPAKLDGQGEVKDPAKLTASIESVDNLSGFVAFAAAANGERLRIDINPADSELESFQGDGFLKGAKWAQGTGSSIKCSIEFAFDDHAKTLEFIGTRLGMDGFAHFEANVTMTLIQPKLLDTELIEHGSEA